MADTSQPGPARANLLGWPSEHERLVASVAEVVDAAPSPRVASLTVGGATGGVGATTVAITSAAWSVWQGRRALTVVLADVGLVSVGDSRRAAAGRRLVLVP